MGRAPNCRPECTVNSDCPSNLACVNQKCKNPCISSCGLNAECTVTSHIPLCTCMMGFIGDPFTSCRQKPECKHIPPPFSLENSFNFPKIKISVTYLPPDETPCARNPCGQNAVCRELNDAGSCTCIQNYYGDPYIACRPECVMNSECALTKACINTRCKDPCIGVCDSNAVCNVVNHSPTCNCITGYVGNPFESCNRESKTTVKQHSKRCPF